MNFLFSFNNKNIKGSDNMGKCELKNIKSISIFNQSTKKKIFEITGFEPIISSKEFEFIEIPIEFKEEFKGIDEDKIFKLEVEFTDDGFKYKVIYPKVKTDGKKFYAAKDKNGKIAYLEEVK